MNAKKLQAEIVETMLRNLRILREKNGGPLDVDADECERDYMHGFSKISICAQCFLPCGGELARQFAPSSACCVECVTMVTE